MTGLRASLIALAIGSALASLAAPLQAQRAPAAPAIPAASLSALPGLLREARGLIGAGQPEAAYHLLEPRSPDYAGSVEFDYLLGISALDSGRPSQAVMALERLLANQPEHTLARAEIARAYLALNEPGAARREFEAVARTSLPPEVNDTIQRYLAILAQPAAGDSRRWSAQIEAAIGYDSNPNFGSSRDLWVLGDGTALTPASASRPRRSAVSELGARLQYTAPINGQVDWTIGAELNQRNHASQHNVDLGSVAVSGGLALKRGPDRYSTSLQVQRLTLDDRSFRSAAGLTGQWQREVDARTQLGAYAQWFTLDYAGQPIRDARRTVAGVTAARGLGDRARSVVFGNAYVGREASRRDFGELSFDLVGLRAAYSRQLGAQWRGTASLSWEHRSHDDADTFFGEHRRDRQFEIRISADREIGAHLTLTPQLIHTRNASTLAPNDFRRTQVLMAIRYRF